MEDVFPVEVKLLEEARILQVTWNDEHVSDYPLDYIRGWCPCAVCQGHFTNEYKYIETQGKKIVDVRPVGNYGMSIVWDDGHDTGIYQFELLRKMCPSPKMDPEGLRMKERIRPKSEWHF